MPEQDPENGNGNAGDNQVSPVSMPEQLANSKNAAAATEQKKDDATRALINRINIAELLTLGLLIVTCYQGWLARTAIGDARVNSEGQARETTESLRLSKQAADAVVQQANLLRESNNTARETLIANSRAWLAPQSGSSQPPALNTALDVTISFHNTGKTPGFDVLYSAQTMVFTKKQSTSNGPKIFAYLNNCKTAPTGGALGVAYPTSGFTNYTLRAKVDKDLIDQKVIDGGKNLVVAGCFAYKTFEVVHHSSFCFYYEGKQTDPSHWNICAIGNEAD